MRYYTLVVSDAKTGYVIAPDPVTRVFTPSPNNRFTYTSLDQNGVNIPGALNIELDIPVFNYAQPAGAGYIRVWGISLQEIGQASDLNNATIKVYAGMSKGLPLANPVQAGLIVEGAVQQAFGNWVNTDMTLDLIIMPETGQPESPVNLILNWPKNTPLAAAVMATLKTAFPGAPVSVNINPKLVVNYDFTGYYQTLAQFATFLKQASAAIVGGAYAGVDIMVKQNGFVVYDSTTAATPKTIAFTDLIGQPTWIGLQQINFKCVMRADINVGDYVTLPPSLVTTTPQAFSQYRQSSVFKGTFMITDAHHFGNLRQPSWDAWNTTFNAAAQSPP